MTHEKQASARQGFWRLWGWPLALAFVTLTGLTAALFSEGGFGDWFASACLAAPVLACVWFGWLRRSKRRQTAAACAYGRFERMMSRVRFA